MNTITYGYYVVKLKPLAWELAAMELMPLGFVPAYMAPTERYKPLYGALGIAHLPYHPTKRIPTSDSLMALNRLRYVKGVLGYNADTGFAPRLPDSFVPELLSSAAHPPERGVLRISLDSKEEAEELSCACQCHVAARRLRIRGTDESGIDPRQKLGNGTPRAARTYADLQRLANAPCDCCLPATHRKPQHFLSGQEIHLHGLPNTRATYCKHTDTTITVELHLLGRPCRVTVGLGQVYA